jgi:hypothetical protein
MSTSTEDIQPKPKQPFMRCKDILPEVYLTYLSPNAQRLYGTIWNALNGYGSDSIWIKNSHLIERTRIRIEQLDPALSELSSLQLMEITPGLIQNRYRVTDPDVEPAQD